MLSPTEEQGNPATFARRDDARSEHPAALGLLAAGNRPVDGGILRQRLLPGAFTHEFQDLDGGVVVVHDFALSSLADQFTVGRPDDAAHGMNDVPLRGGRQGNAQRLLQSFQPAEQSCWPRWRRTSPRPHPRGLRP